ncbi:MAG TPA: nucleotide exchange factor GrpE [Candidatus Limiplasma sp.]|jgi:molecular chaperone GrpE|nr:nucleotide exchange factor GrpE [Candidatus Limiplasma sp.]HPR77967.1 nucleotide exchange factor GrpE [Candidatus Limiplasma sp.]
MPIRKKTHQNGGNKPNMQAEKNPQNAKPNPAPEKTPEEQEAIDAMTAQLEENTACQTDAETADAEVEAQAQTVETELTEALEAAKAKSDEYLSLAQRVQADFDNYRRRNQNVRAEAYEDGAKAFIVTLLPVLDNLERALGAAGDSSDTSLKDGVEMVCRQLADTLTKRGVAPIDRKGEKFDPNLENAVMKGTPEDGEPGTVCEVLQKGYQMDGYVLRHAMVKVVPD